MIAIFVVITVFVNVWSIVPLPTVRSLHCILQVLISVTYYSHLVDIIWFFRKKYGSFWVKIMLEVASKLVSVYFQFSIIVNLKNTPDYYFKLPARIKQSNGDKLPIA